MLVNASKLSVDTGLQPQFILLVEDPHFIVPIGGGINIPPSDAFARARNGVWIVFGSRAVLTAAENICKTSAYSIQLSKEIYIC
jgi:hypothetical protein